MEEDKMDSEREVKMVAAVWALRAIMTPEGFKKFNLDEGEVFWGNEHLKELVDYWREAQTPNILRLLSSKSLKTVDRGLNSVPLTRQGIFFVNLGKLQNLLSLSDEEREVLLFSLLFNEVNGLAEAINEARINGPAEFISHVSRIIRVSPSDIRRTLKKDSALCSSGLIQFDPDRRFCGIEPLQGLYDALFKPGAGVEDLLASYFSKSPAPRLNLKDFSHHPDLKILLGYLGTALESREAGNIAIAKSFFR
jgi:hypothetical protein